VPFGRNRESRSREAGARRNWPEAVPGKMRGRKRLAYCTRKIGVAREVRSRPQDKAGRRPRLGKFLCRLIYT
jgi:hypothetical protein